MGLAELIAILNNRLAYLASQRTEAFSRGDINMLALLDADIDKTTGTLHVLQQVA